MARRRGNGEGSIYRRTTTDGRWCGSISLGYNEQGRLIRKVVTAKTRAEVVTKLKALQRQLDDGLPLPDATLTVSTLLERWQEDVLRHQVTESAALSYMSIARHHIMPTLGRRKLAALITSEIDRLLSSKVDRGLAISSVRRIRSVLAQAIDQGIGWGVVSRDVATLARAPRAQRIEGELSPQSKHISFSRSFRVTVTRRCTHSCSRLDFDVARRSGFGGTISMSNLASFRFAVNLSVRRQDWLLPTPRRPGVADPSTCPVPC